jgi:SAM-dependent methyltransferase
MESSRGSTPNYRDPESRSAVERYRLRYAQFARAPESLGWRAATQEVRFAAFMKGFSVVLPRSVLDIGCGFADLLAFLRARGWDGAYVGVDIVPEFIAEASKAFADDPHASFHCLDFMEHAERLTADAAFSSGLLNHKRDTAHEDYIERFVTAVARASQCYAAVDFLSNTADRRRDDLFFHDAGRLLQIGLRLSKRAELDHSYMPYEFMLKLWFPDTTPAEIPVF